MYMCAYTMLHAWTSEGSLWESAFSFILGVLVLSSHLQAADVFTHRTVLPAQGFCFLIQSASLYLLNEESESVQYSGLLLKGVLIPLIFLMLLCIVFSLSLFV